MRVVYSTGVYVYALLSELGCFIDLCRAGVYIDFRRLLSMTVMVPRCVYIYLCVYSGSRGGERRRVLVLGAGFYGYFLEELLRCRNSRRYCSSMFIGRFTRRWEGSRWNKNHRKLSKHLLPRRNSVMMMAGRWIVIDAVIIILFVISYLTRNSFVIFFSSCKFMIYKIINI